MHQSHDTSINQKLEDKYWSVGHCLRMVQQQELKDAVRLEKGTSKSKVRKNRIKQIRMQDHSLTKRDLINCVFDRSRHLTLNKEKY